jgi:hypothetical protein
MAKKKLTSAKAKEMLKNPPHGKPLTERQRKFFGAVASGKEPYEKAQVGNLLQPITMDDVSNFFDLFSVPQKALTKLITGKYQTPSEAMGIKNKAGAFAVDAFLDPMNILGGGAIAKSAMARKAASQMAKKSGNFENVIKKGLDIHDVRLKYHNNMILDFDEIDMLNKFGAGNKKNYEGAIAKDYIGKSLVADKPEKNVLGKLNKSEESIEEILLGKEQPKVDIPNKSKASQVDLSNKRTTEIFQPEEKINIPKKTKFSFYSDPYERTKVSREADKWLEDWFYDPTTKQKFMDYGGTEVEWNTVLNSLENPIKSNYKWGKGQPGGIYDPILKQASIPLDAPVDYGVHEGIHKTRMLLRQKEPMLHGLWNDFTDAVRLTPAEAYPEIFRFRNKLGLKPGQTIDLKTMEDNLDLISDGYYLPYKIKDKNKLLEIINKAPMLIPPATILGAEALEKKQDGGGIESRMGGLTDKGFNYNGAWGGTMQFGGEIPQAQNGLIEKLKSRLNPYNWGVEDYSKEKDFNNAYSTAKKFGEKEFMYKGKRYNTKYAGTPRQEVGTYGVDGKSVHLMNINDPAQVNLYPVFGKYLPSHIEASIKDNQTSVNYSSTGNFPFGINKVKNKGEKSFNVYGQNNLIFSNKVASLPTGDYMIENVKDFDESTPSDWNLFTNNCADNVCDAFGIPRNKGIQTPSGAISKIKEKYPTLDVTGRTYEDYDNLYKELQNQSNEKILSQAKNILGVASSPEIQKSGLSKKLISTLQGVLHDEGYDLPNSLKQDDSYDGIYGPETKKALEDWKKKNKSFAIGGSVPGATGNMYARTGAPSEGKYAKKTMPSAAEGYDVLPDPTDPERKYKLSAVVASAKDILNPLLRKKNPKVYDEWEKGRVEALKKGMSAAEEYYQKNPLQQFLTPSEVKSALSQQRKGLYEDYVGALRDLREYEGISPFQRASLVGQMEEEQQPIESLNYGYRFATQPVNISRIVENKPEESFSYSYNPKTGEYTKLPSMAGGGKMMSYYQAGLDFQPKTISKKGSKIKKDNAGYWNPENWGKPVEIDSNFITMDGVYEPLLGVSDTGDTQMMYPGEDYVFDGESVTEYPMARNGVGVNQADEFPLEKLDNLTNFTNYNNMAKAKKGKKLPKAQSGLGMFANPAAMQNLGKAVRKVSGPKNMFPSIAMGIGNVVGGIQQLKEEKEMMQGAKQSLALSDVTKQAAGLKPERVKRKYERPEDNLLSSDQMAFPSYGTGYDVLGMAEDGMQIGGNLTEIQNTYAPNTLYDNLGYEPLDESSRVKQYDNGGFLNTIRGGMQNLATNVGNFASDFGQSFKDPENVGTYGNIISGVLRGPQSTFSGASQVAKGISSVAGKFGLPGKIVGAGVQAIGSIIDRSRQNKLDNLQDQTFANMQEGAFEQGVQSLQNQYSGYMKDGGWVSHDWQPQVITKFGEYSVKDLLAPPKDADMLRAGGHLKSYTPPSERAMQTYAMGGGLMVEDRGDVEFMGYNPEIAKTGASGYIGISRGPSHDKGGFNIDYNGSKVEVEGGETMLEKGGSVGQDNAMHVLGNMKLEKLGEGMMQGEAKSGTLDKLVKGEKLANMTFKSIGNKVAKEVKRLNKLENKAIDLANSVDGYTSLDKIQLDTANAKLTGAKMGYKDTKNITDNLVSLQDAYHETAKEFGYDDETPDFLKNLKKGKLGEAKMGKKIEKAQAGASIVDYLRSQNQPFSMTDRKKLAQEAGIKDYRGTASQNTALLNYMQNKQSTPTKLKANLETPQFMQPVDFEQSLYTPKGIPQLSDVVKNRYDITGVVPQELSFESDYYNTPEERYAMSKPVGIPSSIAAMVERAATQARQSSSKGAAKEAGKASDNMGDYAKMIYNEILPYVRPINQLPLSPEQLMGEQFALATNVLEPVQAQTYQPMLETRAPQMTAQAMLNENQASFNALARQIGNNPAALSVLAAQKQKADSQAIAQVEAANQAQRQAVAARNIGVLNDATLKNLAILDNQYQRQTQARAATKAQAQAALNSIASKIGQNKLENLTSGVMQNMYNYRFGPKGRIVNYNPMADFTIPNVANLSDETKKAIAEQAPELAKQLGLSKSSKKEARNGSIVKAIKNL